MLYRAELSNGQNRASAEGNSDDEAISRALADSFTLRLADPTKVSVSVFRVTGEDASVAYCTTLSKYRADTN